MKAVQITQYETTDGKTFEYEIEAMQHQAALDASSDIEAFITHLETGDRNAARIRNLLTEYVKFQATQTEPCS